MRQAVLERYERASDGRIAIDVAARKTGDLYNDFDRSAPYVRRDLDQDLVDYLIAAAREVGREPFVIRFTLADPPDADRLARIRRSVNDYCLYLIAVEQHQTRHMVRQFTCPILSNVAYMTLSGPLVALCGMPPDWA